MAYTREQIGQALKAAHEAGDVEAARTLAVAYRDWKPSNAVEVGPTPTMRAAQLRVNENLRTGNPFVGGGVRDQIEAMGRPTAAEIESAPTEQEFAAWSAQQDAAREARRVPDNDFKERTIAAMNGPTWGNAPRLAAGAQTVGALLATPFVEGDIIDQKGISGATSQFLDEARIHQRRGREERGLETAAIEIVPALFQGKTVFDTLGKKFLPNTNTVSNVARTVGVSALGGATYMGSQNESGTAEGVAQDAAWGGLIGGGFGVGMKVAEPGAIATYRTAKTAGASLYDAAAAALGRAVGARDRVARDVAVAAVRRSMDRSGMTLDEIMALVKKYEGKPAVLAEVIGEDAVNALTALANRKGSTPQKALDIGDERAFGRPDRMVGDIEDATGISAGQLDDTLATQLEARQEAADPLYKALYKQFNKIEAFRQPGQTGQVMKRLNRLARTPLAKRHLQAAKDAVATEAGRRSIAVSKMSTMEYWDLVKRSLDNAIDSAQKRGDGSTKVGEDVSDLVGLKADLVSELDRLTNGAYATVRQAGGEAPRLKAAAVAGQKALQARNPREVAKTVAATLPQDLPALQAGMVDDLATRIKKGTLLPNRFRRPDPAGKLRAVFGDDVGGKIIEKMDAEAQLASSGAKWAPRTGPKTSVVLENGPGGMADDLMDAGINLATGNKLEFGRKVMNFLRQRGFSQRQIDAIGDLLLSSPEEGLKRLRVMAPDGTPTNALAPATGLPPPDGGPTPPSMPTPTAGAPAGPIRASGFSGLRTDAQNAAFGAGVGALGPAESPEERLRNMAIGAGFGASARTLDDVVRIGAPRNALADTATAGFRGQSRGPNAGRFRFGPTGKAFNPYSAQVQAEIIRTSGGLVDERNIDDLVSIYMDDLVDSTPQQIVNDLRSDAAMNMKTGGIQMTQRDVEYVAFAELMARQLKPMRGGTDDILPGGFAGGGRKGKNALSSPLPQTRSGSGREELLAPEQQLNPDTAAGARGQIKSPYVDSDYRGKGIGFQDPSAYYIKTLEDLKTRFATGRGSTDGFDELHDANLAMQELIRQERGMAGRYIPTPREEGEIAQEAARRVMSDIRANNIMPEQTAPKALPNSPKPIMPGGFAGGGRGPRLGRDAPDTLPPNDRTNRTLPTRLRNPPAPVDDTKPVVIPPGYGQPARPPVTVKSPGQVIAKGLRGIDRGLRAPDSERVIAPVLAAGKMRKPKRGETALEAMRAPQEVAQAVADAMRRGNTAAMTDLARPKLGKMGQKNAQIVQEYRNRLQSKADSQLGVEAIRTQQNRALKAAKDALSELHGDLARAVTRNDEAGQVSAAKSMEALRQQIADIKKVTPMKQRQAVDATLALIDTAILQAEQAAKAPGYAFRTALEPGRRKLQRDEEVLDLLTNPNRAKDAYRISQAKPLGSFEKTGQALALAGLGGAGAVSYMAAENEKKRGEKSYVEQRDAWSVQNKHVSTYSGDKLAEVQAFLNYVVPPEEGEAQLATDGKFGEPGKSNTSARIKRYQKMRGLTVNGRMTWETILDLESQMSGSRPEQE